jgi:hypothetical protein
MMKAFVLLGGLLLFVFAGRAIRMLLKTKERPNAENNWQNQHHIALQNEGSWAENEHSVTHRDTSPPRII